jgi:hypothetical protein
MMVPGLPRPGPVLKHAGDAGRCALSGDCLRLPPPAREAVHGDIGTPQGYITAMVASVFTRNRGQ